MNNLFRNLVKKPPKHEKGEIVVADSGNVKEVAKIMIGFEALLRETQSYMSKACGNKLFDSDLKDAMRQLIKQYMKDHNYYVPHMNLAEAADRLYVEMAEYSFLTPLLARKDIEEININSWDDIQIIPSKGQQYKYSEHFSSAQHAVDVVRRMLHNNKLAGVIKIAPVFITKMTLNSYANELCREAEIAGRIGTETTARLDRLNESHPDLEPTVTWSANGNIQIGRTFSVTVSTDYDFSFFVFNTTPITISATAEGTSEVFWK